MLIRYLGVRGSTPAPGSDFVRYGGHTSCVAVSSVPAASTGADGADSSTGYGPPRLVLDAGTGLRALGEHLDGQAFQGTILVSHLHWDHVHGLPFFVQGDRPDASVDLFLPAQDGATGLSLLSRAMSPPSFPITPDQLGGRWDFHAIEPGTFTVEGVVVTAAEINHKGGRTFGYRLEDEHGSMAYLPDHAPAAGVTEGALELAHDVDVLLHDSQFVEAERSLADLYGHATVDDAVAFAVSAGARSLVLFHHGPSRTDDRLEQILAATDAPIPVTLARQGDTLDIGVQR